MSDNDDAKFRGAPAVKPRNTEAERAQGRAYPPETDSQRASDVDGGSIRSTFEPVGSEGSSLPDPNRPSDAQTAREILTDPITGAPIDPPDPENNQA